MNTSIAELDWKFWKNEKRPKETNPTRVQSGSSLRDHLSPDQSLWRGAAKAARADLERLVRRLSRGGRRAQGDDEVESSKKSIFDLRVQNDWHKATLSGLEPPLKTSATRLDRHFSKYSKKKMRRRQTLRSFGRCGLKCTWRTDAQSW